MARDWALQLVPRSFVEVGTDHVPAHNGGKCVFPFYEASHVRCRRRAPLLAEPDQTPHITMWHYGCGRLLRCGCAGSMRREGYGGCAGAVVLGYGRSAPLNTGVECLSSPQHRGSKATCRPPCAWGSEKIPKVLTHRDGASRAEDGRRRAKETRFCVKSVASLWVPLCWSGTTVGSLLDLFIPDRTV